MAATLPPFSPQLPSPQALFLPLSVWLEVAQSGAGALRLPRRAHLSVALCCPRPPTPLPCQPQPLSCPGTSTLEVVGRRHWHRRRSVHASEHLPQGRTSCQSPREGPGGGGGGPGGGPCTGGNKCCSLRLKKEPWCAQEGTHGNQTLPGSRLRLALALGGGKPFPMRMSKNITLLCPGWLSPSGASELAASSAFISTKDFTRVPPANRHPLPASRPLPAVGSGSVAGRPTPAVGMHSFNVCTVCVCACVCTYVRVNPAAHHSPTALGVFVFVFISFRFTTERS